MLCMFDRAPIAMGRKRGYFRDETTRALLGLNKGNFMQNSGTYGTKEIAEQPVEFDLLRNGTYDQCFLPFVPCNRGTLRLRWIELRYNNHQSQHGDNSISVKNTGGIL
jgi:hypothetical protein